MIPSTILLQIDLGEGHNFMSFETFSTPPRLCEHRGKGPGRPNSTGMLERGAIEDRQLRLRISVHYVSSSGPPVLGCPYAMRFSDANRCARQSIRCSVLGSLLSSSVTIREFAL
jgi:hypothetical protein